MSGFGKSGYGYGSYGEGESGISVAHVSPVDLSVDQSPWPTIVVDVTAPDGELPDHTKITLTLEGERVYNNGLPAANWQRRELGLGGGVYRYYFEYRGDPYGNGQVVNCVVSYDNSTAPDSIDTWSFTVAIAMIVTAVAWLSATSARVTFSREPKRDSALFDPSSYSFPVLAGYARQVIPKSVTHTEGNLFVDVTVDDWFTTHGKYSVSAESVRDQYGQVVS